MYTFIYDGTNISIQRNWTQIATAPQTTALSSENISFLIGMADSTVTSDCWKGNMKKVRVYNRVLNSTEIGLLYADF
jgi:hypothetical protein